MIPAARALFERMRAVRSAEPLDAKVFRVREAQRALDTACRKLGMPRITHHTLRHFFANDVRSKRGRYADNSEIPKP